MSFRDYDVRVWSDGDVNIYSFELLGYDSAGGMQANCDEGDEFCQQLKRACMGAAIAMRRVDDTIGVIERRRLNG